MSKYSLLVKRILCSIKDILSNYRKLNIINDVSSCYVDSTCIPILASLALVCIAIALTAQWSVHGLRVTRYNDSNRMSKYTLLVERIVCSFNVLLSSNRLEVIKCNGSNIMLKTIYHWSNASYVHLKFTY